MKNYLFLTTILILIFAFSINAQNYKAFKKIANNLEKQADELKDHTSRDIKKGNAVTEIEIERAFLSEQISASTKLMKRLVDEKYPLAELNVGNKMLLKMLPNFPTSGSHMNKWDDVKSLINTLNLELNSDQEPNIAKPVNENNINGRVFWTGMVDATVQLVIKDSQIKTITVAGKTYPDGIPSFTASLPNDKEVTVGIKKKKGRGKVKVIQQPNAENDFTAIVEIHDEGGGAKSYTVEVFW